ncbi:MAG: DNA primase, partial [Deltaproteobacteria bacterium]|nr:DNA primase [Deltaproteobacteria bacterium]
MISPEKIEEVRDKADIVEVISEYVELTKRGANYIGKCPFHSEKTPSFSVNDVKEIFYCFGCHTGGNVITFLMKYETLSFPEAVRSLAERYHIEIKEERYQGKGDDGELEAMVDLNRVALKYFREELKGTGGNKAREYLKDRGFEEGIVDSFRVGLSRDSWDGLVKHLKDGNYDLERGVRAGLLGKKEDDKKDVRYFDRFRGRILFPITDASGRIVGFGGRGMDGEEPKYLNSPETKLFKKASILYGFYQAKREISRDASAIVVEGYFDLLALHKYGFKSVVATMGTALTPEHIRRLKPYAKTIYTLFDFDEAGVKAAVRGLGLFLEAGIEAKIIVLPEGKDPDDFLKEEGADGLRQAISKAEPLM